MNAEYSSGSRSESSPSVSACSASDRSEKWMRNGRSPPCALATLTAPLAAIASPSAAYTGSVIGGRPRIATFSRGSSAPRCT